MYAEKKDYLSIIDQTLTNYQWYFRTRWYKIGYMRKSRPSQKGHCVLYVPAGIAATFKYTTICRKLMDKPVPSLADPDPIEREVWCLSFQRNLKDYEKTWEGIDYIICSYKEGDDRYMIYLNAKKLLHYLRQTLADPIGWDGQVIPRQTIHKDSVRLPALLDAGVVEMMDVIKKNGSIKIELNNSPYPAPEHFRSSQCFPINKWTHKPKEVNDSDLDWAHFHLLGRYQSKNRQKKVGVIQIDNGKMVEFDSLTSAAIELSRMGKTITINQLVNCLKGRANSFKTPKGKFRIFLLAEA